MPEDLTYLDPELLKWALKPGTDFHLDKDNALTVKQSPPKEEKVEGAPKETPTPTTDPRIPFSAYASMMAPPTGPSAAELRGLAPEQVMAVMDAAGAAREAGRRTLADVEGWGLRETQRGLLEARIRDLLAPDVATALDVARTGLLKKQTEAVRPPLSFKERMKLKKAGPPKAPKEPSMFEKKMPITAHDTMMEAIVDKDGNLLDYPDVARVTAANKVFGKHGLEIIGVDVDEAKRAGWFGLDWLAKDVPAQTILVVTEKGKEPTREQIEESLVSYYGWSPKEVKKAKVKSK